MAKVIPLRKAPRAKLTVPQEKFWLVLQNEANRSLYIRDICKLAGYHSDSSWYKVMADDEFRAQVEALGVMVKREIQVHGKGVIIAITENADDEWSQDCIDVRRLMAEYPKHCGTGAFRLDFSCICNPVLKALVKRYFRARVGFWSALTFKNVLKSMKPFLIALGEKYPHVETFSVLSREMIEPFLVLPSWVDSKGRMHPIS